MLLLNGDTCFEGKIHGCGRLINGSCKYHHVLIPVNMLWHCCCSITQPFQLFVTPWTAACQASLFFTVSQSLLKLMSIEWVLSFNHLVLCRPLLLPSILPSIRVFSNESAICIRWPKYWSVSISLSNEYSELISFRIAWFDLLAVQGTLESLLQHHGNLVINSSNDSFKNMK